MLPKHHNLKTFGVVQILCNIIIDHFVPPLPCDRFLSENVMGMAFDDWHQSIETEKLY